MSLIIFLIMFLHLGFVPITYNRSGKRFSCISSILVYDVYTYFQCASGILIPLIVSLGFILIPFFVLFWALRFLSDPIQSGNYLTDWI